MPLYEYLCQDCEQQSELLVTATKEPACPQCGGRRLTKLLSLVAAPARDSSGSTRPETSLGPCGAHCGCHPHR